MWYSDNMTDISTLHDCCSPAGVVFLMVHLTTPGLPLVGEYLDTLSPAGINI